MTEPNTRQRFMRGLILYPLALCDYAFFGLPLSVGDWEVRLTPDQRNDLGNLLLGALLLCVMTPVAVPVAALRRLARTEPTAYLFGRSE